MKTLVTILAVVMMAVPASATLVNYTVTGWGPVNYPGSLWSGDILQMVTYAGQLDLTLGTQTLKINTLKWTVDSTGNPQTFNVVTTRNITFDGGATGALPQNGYLEALSDNDYLTFYNGTPLTLTVQGYQVEITPLGFLRKGAGGPFNGLPWPQADTDIMATFVVTPEPATIAILGLGSLFFARRKK